MAVEARERVCLGELWWEPYSSSEVDVQSEPCCRRRVSRVSELVPEARTEHSLTQYPLQPRVPTSKGPAAAKRQGVQGHHQPRGTCRDGQPGISTGPEPRPLDGNQRLGGRGSGARPPQMAKLPDGTYRVTEQGPCNMPGLLTLNPGPDLLSPPGPCGSCKHAQWGAGSVPPSNCGPQPSAICPSSREAISPPALPAQSPQQSARGRG